MTKAALRARVAGLRVRQLLAERDRDAILRCKGTNVLPYLTGVPEEGLLIASEQEQLDTLATEIETLRSEIREMEASLAT